MVQNCTFYNPSDIGVSLLFDKDVAIRNSSFSYFNGISPSLAATLGAWCGILAFAPPVENVAVLNNTFNGNVPMASTSDYAADGLVWLSNGGKWIVEGNGITNYGLEAVQLNAGPYSVVGNAFNTMSTCNSACALNTFQNAGTSSISSPNSINSTYCFVGNTVAGGVTGVLDPDAAGAYGPYNLIVSANQFNLSQGTYPYPPVNSQMANLVRSKTVTVTGNNIINANRAVNFLNYTTSNPGNQACTIYALCNDFGNVNLASLFVQDPGNKLRSATNIANKLGNGWGLGHFHLELPTNSPPTLHVRGNRFWNNGSSPLVTSVTLSQSLWNDFDGWVGCQFQVGGAPLVATYLGTVQ